MSDPEPMDEQPGGSSWEEVTDEQGTYYFNSSTGETAWENPEAAPSNLGATLGAALGEKLAAARKAAKQAKQAKQAMLAKQAGSMRKRIYSPHETVIFIFLKKRR